MTTKVTKINNPGCAAPCFKAESSEELTDTICEDLQHKAGYPPAGYGMSRVKYEKEGDTFIATWSCLPSSD